jgi:hypothetical protein
MVTVLRPLSISELLDRTFHLYRNNFLVFVGIAAIPQLFILALQVSSSALLFVGSPLGFGAMAIVAGIASWFAIQLSQAAAIVAVSNLHLERPISVGATYSAVKKSLPRVLWIAFAIVAIPLLIVMAVVMVLAAVTIPILLVTKTIGAGGMDNVTLIRTVAGLTAIVALLVVLVGLRWWIAWALAIPATVLEGGGLRVTLRRSKELTKGARGRIVLVVIIIGALAWVIGSMVQLPLLLLTGFQALRHPDNVGPLTHVIQAVGGFVSASLVGSLATIALTLIYYDQRVRKEGFDLQLMMAALQPESSQVAQAAPAS